MQRVLSPAEVRFLTEAERPLLANLIQRLLAVDGRYNLETLLLQVQTSQVADIRLVIYDQYDFTARNCLPDGRQLREQGDGFDFHQRA